MDLGIDLSVATLKEYALAQGITKSWTEMTQAEKVMLRYRYLMDNTRQQQNDFQRTNLSLANSFRTLRAYTAEITRQIGVGLGAAIRHAVVGLNMLMKYVLKAAQAFSAFMQKIFGKYEGGATFVDLDMSGLSDDMGDFADGADSAADGLDDASDSAEKLKKDLSVLPFDELNQLNKDQEKTSSTTGKGSGAGGDIGGLGDMGEYGEGMFANSVRESERELTDFEKFLKDWHDKCAKSLDAKDWEGLGANIAWGINTGIKTLYDALDPEKVSEKINPWIDAFSTTFNSLVDHINWEQFGGLIGRWITNAVNAMNRLLDPKTGIDFENLGGKLGDGFNGMIRNINWRGVGNLISNKFMVGWRIFSGFVKKLDAKDVGNALRDAIGGVVEKLDAETIGSSLGMFVTKCATVIKTAFGNKETWSDLGTKLGEGINAFFREFNGKEVAEGISAFLNAIVTTIGSMLKTLDTSGLITSIKDFVINLDWDTIAAFGAPLASTKFLTAVGTALVQNFIAMNSLATAIANTIANACALVGSSPEMAEAANQVTTALGTALSNGISVLGNMLFPAASGFGLTFIPKLLGADNRSTDLLNFQNDITTTTSNVETTMSGSANNISGTIASVATLISNSIFGTKTSVEENIGSMDTTTTEATGRWLGAYQGVVDKLQFLGQKHQEELAGTAKTAVETFTNAVMQGASNMSLSWSTLTTDESGHTQSLVESLNTQTASIQEWERNLTTLAKAGVDEGFLTELARMGTEGTPAVQSALEQIEKEGGVEELNASWQSLIDAKGMMDDVGKELQEAGVTNISESFGVLKEQLETDSSELPNGIKSGLEKNAPLSKDAIEQLATDMNNQYRTYWQIGSPSRTMEDNSSDIIDGIVDGIEDNEDNATGVMETLANSMMDAFSDTIDISGMIDSAFSGIEDIYSSAETYGENIAQSLANGISNVTIPTISINIDYQWVDFGDYQQLIPSSIYPSISYYAKGGLFTNAAVFGEAGDEAAIPLENKGVMNRIANAIIDNSGGAFGMDENAMANAVARGYVQAMMANQGNERPIDVYATLYTENNEVLARAVTRGQQSIDYRNNATPKFSY